jgi:hypothetical protein
MVGLGEAYAHLQKTETYIAAIQAIDLVKLFATLSETVITSVGQNEVLDVQLLGS